MKTSRDKLNSKKSDTTDISKPWDKDNQAWWDWYVGLADNDTKKNPIITAEPLPNVTIPSDDEVVSELTETYPLKNDQIDILDAEPGDLHFFGVKNKVTHVGFSTKAAGILHSQGSVKIETIDSSKINYNKNLLDIYLSTHSIKRKFD